MKLRVFLILSSLGLLVAQVHLAMPQTAQVTTLSLADAEARTLKNQPRLAAEALRAQALGKRVQQTRSAYFPQLTANLTAVKANGDSAVAAGAVTTSSISSRVAGGVTTGSATVRWPTKVHGIPMTCLTNAFSRFGNRSSPLCWSEPHRGR